VDLGRLRKGEWLTLAASVGLLAATFAPWFGADLPAGSFAVPDVALTAWQAFSLWDLLLALLAAMGLSVALLAAVRRAPAGPLAAVVLTTGAAILLGPVLLLRIVFPPGPNALVEPRYGAWLGLLTVAGIAAGAWLAMGDERTETVDPPFVPAQPTPPEVAPAGSVVAEGRVPSADDDRD